MLLLRVGLRRLLRRLLGPKTPTPSSMLLLVAIEAVLLHIRPLLRVLLLMLVLHVVWVVGWPAPAMRRGPCHGEASAAWPHESVAARGCGA